MITFGNHCEILCFFFRTANNVNGSARRHSPAVSPSHPHGGGGGGSRPMSLMDSPNHHPHHQTQTHIVRVVVNKNERGYGMKVSGDNPVYVQSVKEGKKYICIYKWWSFKRKRGSIISATVILNCNKKIYEKKLNYIYMFMSDTVLPDLRIIK